MNDFDNLLIPIWKDSDWTSNDIIKFIKPYLKPHKIGHTGTLDPFAEGILLICIGKMTKQVSNLMELKKEYHARIIVQKHIQRSLIRVSSEIIHDAYDESSDVLDL